MHDEPAVEARGLTKRYGARIVAVNRLDLTIRRGEIYGFVGLNGAGKTTTMRLLLGQIRPSAGVAIVLGHAPGDPAGLARLGALIEAPVFYPHLSGQDNLRVLARYAGLPDARVSAALDLVALAPRGGDRFRTYSLGMKQRLGVAAALLKDPDLLILDEPTNGLDPGGMADMRALIRDLGAIGRTILFSSHQLADVQHLSDRVGVMGGGRLVAEGTVAELLGPPILLLRADPPDEARRRVEAVVGGGRVRADGDALLIDLGVADATAIGRALALGGVTVRELRPVERTLDAIFVDLTGGGTADADSLRTAGE